VKDISFKLFASSDETKYCNFVFVTAPNTGTNNIKQYSYQSGCFDGTIVDKTTTATIEDYSKFN
jgi:hypothetical protein